MSHFTTVAVQFKNREALVEALVANGIPRSAIEVHDTPQLLRDYRGNTTKYRYKDTKDERFAKGDCAHVIVRRDVLGSANNDLGFYIDQEGESISFLCDYSRQATRWNDEWLGHVRQSYSISEIEAEHAEKCETTTRVQHGGKVYIYVKAG